MSISVKNGFAFKYESYQNLDMRHSKLTLTRGAVMKMALDMENGTNVNLNLFHKYIFLIILHLLLRVVETRRSVTLDPP